MIRLFLVTTIILLTLNSCRENSKKQPTTSKPVLDWTPPPFGWLQSTNKNEKKIEIIPEDSLFVFDGISSTEILDKGVWDFDYFFVDSTKRRSYLKFDNYLKLKLLPNILKMDTLWIKEDIQAYLISKQGRIGNIHPIIVQTFGTDFSALLLINLNEKGDFISGTFLYGGEDDGSGVELETDSLILLRPISKCYFDNNLIYTYSIYAQIQKYNLNKPDVIDSVTYQTTIELDGTIRKYKLDSIRIYRKFTDKTLYSP